MIAWIRGTLTSIEGTVAVLRQGDLAREVLVPLYFSRDLQPQAGQTVSMHTLEYLESLNQGASFNPRLLGFPTGDDRRFFELFTTVKGIGNRRALRAMAEPPVTIAAWIAARDTKSLTSLPEVGKRVAETIIAELSGKVEAQGFSVAGTSIPASAIVENSLEATAIAGLVALGETRPDAEMKVRRAMRTTPAPTEPGALIARALATV